MIGAAMRIVKVGVLAPTNKGIPLGVQGENHATQVEFDTRPWFREYPSGTVSAVARRDGDPAPYPLTLDVADGTAVWQVSDTDTAKAGEGAVELTMTSGGARVRSLTFKTLVTASLTDAPVDDDAWYGWLDKAVVKVDETVQSAQRKMAEVDAEWTGLKADVTAKVEECGGAAAQAASDAHHAKADAQAAAKALESAEGSIVKAEAAANRAVDAALAADDSAVEASRSALSAGDSAEAARLSADAAANSAGDAETSASSAADAASAASGSASTAAQSATDANSAKVAAQTAKAEAETSASNAATSASNAESSATAAAKSASDAAASVNAINIITPTKTSVPPSQKNGIAVGAGAVSNGTWALAIGNFAVANGAGAAALASQAHATNNFSTAAVNGATTSRDREFSVGNPEHTSYVANVTTPSLDYDASNKKYTDANDAKTLSEAKKYTDDNDAKTLSEAKKYTDANTSNALVGTVSGKLLHVEDAWPSKPVSLTIDGAYKQDGTPSPENPVPITVVENPVLHVTGRNLVDIPNHDVPENDIRGFFKFGLIPSGTTAYISCVSSSDVNSKYYDAASSGLGRDKDVVYSTHPTSLKVGINKVEITPNFDANEHLPLYGYRIPMTSFHMSNYQLEVGGYHDYRPYTSASLPITLPDEHPYLAKLPDGTADTIDVDKDGNVKLVARVGKTETASTDGVSATVGTDALSSTGAITDGATVYYKLATPITYSLGKLNIPSLPETISNVWTDAEVTTNMNMTYKRDINIAFDNLVQAVVAAAAGE